MSAVLSRVVATGLLVATVLVTASSVFAQKQVVRIGVVVDGPWEGNERILSMTREEVLTLTDGEFDIRFPTDKLIYSDWTVPGIDTAIDRLLADPDVDFVLASGVIASGLVSRKGDLPKPVIAPFVVDAELQGLPNQDGSSGVKNLTYLSLPARVLSDIHLFHEIVPFDRVTLLVNKEVWDSIPMLTERLSMVLAAMQVQPKILAVEQTIDSVLPDLTEATEAVYIVPLMQLKDGEFDRLIQTLIERKIPSFSLLGIQEVERGIMATGSPDIFPKIARRIALNVQRILLGDEPGKIPTAFAVGEQVTINMGTARAIGVSPPFSVLTEAVLVNEASRVVARRVNLAGAMREAVDKNLDLMAEQSRVAAGAQNVNIARSALLPQIEVTSTRLFIDADRAAASFGTQAQRTWNASFAVTQLLYSEKAWANHTIQRHIQRSREQELQQVRLDITQSAATAYLNVLRAKTFENVQKANLRRTRSHLELAQVRESIGYSGAAEVFRWQSQIANDRKSVIAAIAQRNVAEIALNRLLHRPAEDPFRTADADLKDPSLGASRPGLLDYFDDPVSFDTFRDFMEQDALSLAPELKTLDAAIAAKQREVRSTTNSFLAPTLALQFEWSRLLTESGAGAEGAQFAGSDLSLPQANDTNWSLGLKASYPIFEGAARFAERNRANRELHQLRRQRDSIAERVEQRIRSALHVAGASRVGIQLSNDAATAAVKNLDLVIDGYSRGVLDILDLLDAQNAALNAELAAANAVYDFLIDLIEVERAKGGFYLFATPAERDDWFNRLQEYFETAGVSPGGR